MSLTHYNRRIKSEYYPYDLYTKTRWRVWTKVLLTMSILAVIGTGAGIATVYGTQTWVRNGCFTVNYVDLRGGYANAALYTTIGIVDQDGDVRMGEIGKWHAGDSYCGPIQYGVGQFDPIVRFGSTVNTKHELPTSPFAPPPTVGDGP